MSYKYLLKRINNIIKEIQKSHCNIITCEKTVQLVEPSSESIQDLLFYF